MNKACTRWVNHVWYQDTRIATCLMPLAFLFGGMVRFRRFLYRVGALKSHRFPVPVIIIGNITVGGAGKTPLLVCLAEHLKKAGFKPGVVSRGYGGTAKSWPQPVNADSQAGTVGDEAVLIARRTGCPMAVGPARVAAAAWLLGNTDCNLILSDDGLQHYALQRDVEIAVVDGERRFGNGFCLPAGPLREPTGRLRGVDFVVVNGGAADGDGYAMALSGDVAINVRTKAQKPLSGFVGLDCHAVAGIGNPDRFFKHLAAAGLQCKNHPFPDHYRYQTHDLDFGDGKPVLMTEKDAVKCPALVGTEHWYVPVTASVPAGLITQLLNLLKERS